MGAHGGAGELLPKRIAELEEVARHNDEHGVHDRLALGGRQVLTKWRGAKEAFDDF